MSDAAPHGGPSIDGLLASLPDGGHALPNAVDLLASAPGAPTAGWAMGGLDAFLMHSPMHPDMATLNQDAILQG